MSPHRTIIVLSRDLSFRLDWLRQAERGAHVLLERDLWRRRARLAVPTAATLVIDCRHYDSSEVLDLVRSARELERPVPAILLTDDLDRYRAKLAMRGLLAEVLSSGATAAELLARLGLEPDSTTDRRSP
jgi:hypothetical protein